MTRARCEGCLRLATLCLCDQVVEVDNQVKVLFLQHPLETHQVKNTARLAYACLRNAQWQVGEQFDEALLRSWLSERPYYLLYPETSEDEAALFNATQVLQSSVVSNIGLVVLDGTWRKTRKMLFVNPLLAQLPRLQIRLDGVSNYEIRKQKSAQSFSTLEAVQQALIELEQDSEKFLPLTAVFDALMVQQREWINKA